MDYHYSSQPPVKPKTRKKGCCLWYVLAIILIIILILFLADQITPLSRAIGRHGIGLSQLSDYYALNRDIGETPNMVANHQVIRSLNTHIPTSGSDTTNRVASVIDLYPDLFGLQDFEDNFTLTDEKTLDNGHLLAKFTQSYHGVPIYQSQLNVELDQDGNFVSLNGGYIPNFDDFDTTPKLSQEEALFRAAEKEDLENPTMESTPELVIFDQVVFGEGKSKPILSYRMLVSDNQSTPLDCLIDANKGEFLRCSSPINYTLPPTYYYDGQGYTINKALSEFDEITSLDYYDAQYGKRIQEIYFYLTEINRYYTNKLGYDCGNHCPEEAAIVVNIDKNAAFCLYEPYHLFLFSDDTITADAITHEYTHSVFTALLDNQHPTSLESMAINEGLADSFAAFTDYTDPWTIRGKVKTYRTIDQESQGQAYHYDDLVVPSKKFIFKLPQADEDSNFSHRNSTILSHAAYLLVEGGNSRDQKISVRGIGFDKTAFIFYKAMERVTPNVTFQQFRNEAHFMCETYISPNTDFSPSLVDEDCDQVLNAFAAVGIGQTAAERRASVEKKRSPDLDWGDLEQSLQDLIDKYREKMLQIVIDEASSQFDNFIWTINKALYDFLYGWLQFLLSLFYSS